MEGCRVIHCGYWISSTECIEKIYKLNTTKRKNKMSKKPAINWVMIVIIMTWLLLLTSVLFSGQARADTVLGYHATVVKVIDGDSIKLDVVVWPGTTVRVNVRLIGIDTPENRGKTVCEKALAASAKLFNRKKMPAGKKVILTNVKNGKYAGRVLGKISVNGKDAGETLIAAGHGRPYFGGKRTGWCQ